MAKTIPDAVMDVALNDIKNNANVMHGCSGQPANFAGIDALSLGSVSMSGTDFTLGNGDLSGRKITVAQKSITWSSSGNCNHIVIADSVNSVIKGITTIQEFAVVATETDPILSFDLWEIRDP